MRRLILSGGLMVFAAAVALTATGAFFSDTETSTGNTFTAGSINLTVDSTQHYNGNTCTLLTNGQGTNGTTTAPTGYYWTGTSTYPAPGSPCDGTWTPSDLGAQKFFNFSDVKPGDSGENTVSLHVGTNDAYACADVSITSNAENVAIDPELDAGDTAANGNFDGELAQNLNFFAWKDDGTTAGFQCVNGGPCAADLTEGDNIWQANEFPLFSNIIGPASDALNGKHYTLANSQTGPLVASTTNYIGLQWCAGTLTTPTPGTLVCDGAGMGNISQTDSMTADIAFRVVQSRNNPNFTCGIATSTPPVATTTGILIVTKIVINNNGGTSTISNFPLFVNGMGVVSGVATTTSAGAHSVSETGRAGYQATFGGACASNGAVNVVAGTTTTCTVTNDDIGPTITLTKSVINNDPGTPGTAIPTAFTMRVNGTVVPTGSSIGVNANTSISITEDVFAGYASSSITGVGCPSALGQTFQLGLAQSISCTVINDDNSTL